MRPLIFFLLLTLSLNTYADTITVDLKDIPTSDALRLVAKLTQQNLIISPNITGTVALHLHNASAQDVLHAILSSQNLALIKEGKVLIIAPQSEVLAKKEERQKFQESLNENAALTLQVWQLRFANAEKMAHSLQENTPSVLSKRGSIHFDSRTNQLWAEDLPAKLKALNRLIQKLDVSVKQILIQAKLASVDTDFEHELGISFRSQPSESFASFVNPYHYSLAVAKLADGNWLNIALAAMEQQGRGQLISSPSLFTANQQTASIEAGEEIPYQEVSLSGGTAVTFKKAVLRLKVTPQLLPDHKVLLQLEINQDRPSHRIVQGVPAIDTRQLQTTILVRNGQTFVLGGIYEINSEQDEQRVPFLGKIPGLGLLFQQHYVKKNKRELLIFVTPTEISQTNDDENKK